MAPARAWRFEFLRSPVGPGEWASCSPPRSAVSRGDPHSHVSYPLTAIISDLHGNVPALTVLLEDAHERGARRYVCLGDVVGYGAKPRECLDVVMERCVQNPIDGLEPGLCLQGNHEEALLGSAEDFNPKARAAIEWTRDAIGEGDDKERIDAYWNFIGELAPSASDGVAMFAHGSPSDPVREYMLPRDIRDEVKMRRVFRDMVEGTRVCFVGHSHVPAVYYEDLRLYRPRNRRDEVEVPVEGPYDLGDMRSIINVGSVGQPRDGDPRLSYVLFDGSNVSFVRLAYDHERAAQDIKDTNALPEYLAERLLIGR